jgi:hypothetical protein
MATRTPAGGIAMVKDSTSKRRKPEKAARKPGKTSNTKSGTAPQYVLGPYGDLISREDFERLYGQTLPAPPAEQR